jgi:quercetin dioxygenase-like cupin family protein
VEVSAMSDSRKTSPSGDGEFNAGEAIQAAALVDYATGGIVSRTLRKSDAGTLTAFAFDAGQELSEHTAPFDAWVLVLDGQVELTVGGSSIPASAGDLVLMPADVPHAVRATRRFKMLLTMFRR